MKKKKLVTKRALHIEQCGQCSMAMDGITQPCKKGKKLWVKP